MRSKLLSSLLSCLMVSWSFRPTDVAADHLELIVGAAEGQQGGSESNAMPKLQSPFGIDFDRQGHMYIVELEGGRVHRWTKRAGLATVAGTGAKADEGDGGPASQAVFHSMHAVTIDPAGNLYIADTLNHRVRRLDPLRQVVEPFAGTGAKGNSGDNGPALSATFHGVYCVSFTPDYKALLITDLENRRIHSVDMATGRLNLVAGNGNKGVPSDGSVATESPLVDPRAAAADRFGNVYILERGGHALRKVDHHGRIRTVAGTGTPGIGDADGPALAMPMRGPKHLCVDVDGSVLIADTDNHQIRRYDPASGRLRLVAGSGKRGADGLGGPAKLAELHFPHGVCLDSAGELFIVDTGNNRILKLVRESRIDHP
jgi:sugar lactone lactonase YvrE